MNRDPADTNPNLPAWLRGQPLPPRPDADGLPLARQTPAETDASETIPDWLRAEAGKTLLPDQPQGGEQRERVESASAADSNLPDWLREQADAPSRADAPLPDWLRETEPSNESATTAAGETIPDWLRGLSEDAATPAVQAQPPLPSDDAKTVLPAEGSVPDWLLAIADETPQQPVESAPDWLREAAVPAANDETDQTIDWLRETADQPAEMAAPPQAPVDVQLPAPEPIDWLSDIPTDRIQAAMDDDLDDEQLRATPFSFTGDEPQPSLRAPSGPPSWLGDDDDSTSNWFAPTAEPTAEPTRDLADDDAPAWLSAASEPAASAESTTELSSSTADWLSDAASPDTSASDLWADDPPATPQVPLAQPDMPSWLQDALPSEAEPLANDGVPAWLQPPTTPETPSSAPDWQAAGEPVAGQPQPTADVPDWLRESAALAPTLPDDDPSLPSWLQSQQPSAPLEPTPVSAAPNNAADIPPWLRDEHGATLPTASESGEQDLPPWLQGAASAAAYEAPSIAPTTPTPHVGNWFDDPANGGDEPVGNGDNEFLGTTDLPAWLRRPQEQKAPAETADSRALDWLTRLGSPEEETQLPTAAPIRLAPPANPVKSPAQIQAVALLHELASASAVAAQPETVAVRSSFWQRNTVERALYLLLLLALLIGPLVPAVTQPLEVPPTQTGAATLYDQINTLGPSNIVLIGYDWDARRVAELRPMENAVIDELIARKVKFVLMSTDPQGSLLLYDLRERLNRAGYRPGGEDYLLLGYQPGGEFALRSLAQNVGQLLRSDFQRNDVSTSDLAMGKSTGTGKPLSQLADFSMIMLLADDQVDVQGWMEQVHQAAPTVPFATLMTAEAAPAAEPYIMRQPRVYGLTGTTGALAFTALRGGDSRPIALFASQLRFGMATFAVLLLFGGLIAAIVDAIRRRRA